MAALQEQIEQIVQAKLRHGEAHLETLPNGKVCGDVISPDFEQMSYQERRLHLRQILGSALLPEQFINVSTLLTYTPAEWNVQLTES